MEQQNLFEPITAERFEILSHNELLKYAQLQEKVNAQLIKENQRLRALNDELKETTLLIEDQYIVLRNRIFGKSSEKEGPPELPPGGSGFNDDNEPKPKKTKVQLPSERYPNAIRIERHVEFKEIPDCGCCGVELTDSGMTEDSEHVTVIPKQYIIIQQKRHKYGCEKCHGDLQTAPAPPRIKNGSAYSDDMMIDVVATKYCDLIPIERYTKMAEREGMAGLPPQSLIESTHYVADFVRPVYDLLRTEILSEKVLHADETPHRMLEGDDKSHWYLWGFSSIKSSYFEAHDTRSGDVASSFIQDSDCEFLVSDVYSGYGKAVREANQWRLESDSKHPPIHHVYCNAHSRRRFKEAKDRFLGEATFFVDQYKDIYRLEGLTVDKPPNEILGIRSQMIPFFEDMKKKAIELTPAYSTKSSIGKAMSYFLGNFAELTAFLYNPVLPIDNNSQERLLRNPVIGRKTWYGTHSKKGADTMAILFSIVEACKLNGVNPREYLKCLVADLHQGKKPYTPATFKAN